jgi:thymidylate synthase ThyX
MNEERFAGSPPEPFSQEERRALEPYFTNLDKPVFALINLPEVTKGALFARYSRSKKPLRRLFLDEFLKQTGIASGGAPAVGTQRAEALYERVLSDYGDDSVAQLGGAHVAVEGASNILTKVLEHGRLMAYLEQSTRYIPYTEKEDGRWRYCIPPELKELSLRERYEAFMNLSFGTYVKWLEPMQEYYKERFPKGEDESAAAYKRTIRAKALDALRGLLPAATKSNVGIFGSGQAYEALLLRMRAHPLMEVRQCAEMILGELRKVIPAFVRRIDVPERGGVWGEYLADTRRSTEDLAEDLLRGTAIEPRPVVALTDFDPEGEVKVVAACLYAASHLSDDQLLERARRMPHEERLRVLRAYIGHRRNRRHKPGRAFERTGYRFDILGDYGAFRDLQRHRILSMEWQRLSPQHGFVTPDDVVQCGAKDDWIAVMRESAGVYQLLARRGHELVAPYAVSMAYRVRFFMQMNAREAMHTIELRTQPQGHPSYRRICQEMHRLIGEEAGHRAIAEAMSFVDHSAGETGRLDAEMTSESRHRSK